MLVEPAWSERFNAMIQTLKNEAMEIDKVTNNMQRSDLALSILQGDHAARPTVNEQNAFAQNLIPCDYGISGTAVPDDKLDFRKHLFLCPDKKLRRSSFCNRGFAMTGIGTLSIS